MPGKGEAEAVATFVSRLQQILDCVTSALLCKKHLPTGRVALEDVVYLLISELSVEPRAAHENWEAILRADREEFQRQRCCA